MARRGIEHTTIDGVMSAYELNKQGNFGLFSGNEIMISYNGGDMETGGDMLGEFLQVLQDGNSTATYTLRIYGPSATDKEITNKTPYIASTTCMLSSKIGTRTNEQGIIVLDNQRNAPPQQGPAMGYTQMQAQISQLQQQLDRERELRHQAELSRIEDKFAAQIAGLSAVPEKDIWDKAGDIFDKIFSNADKIGDAIGRIRGTKTNYIVNTNPIAGTGATEPATAPAQPPEQEDMKTTWNPDDKIHERLLDNFITDEERAQNMHSKEVNKLVGERLKTLDQDAHDELQSEALERLEKRIGAPTLSLSLLVLQGMDNNSTNTLLGYLL